MTTLGELIEFTRHQLSGFDSSLDAVSALSAPLDAAATTVPLVDGEGASAGVAEIDFEQVRVRSANPDDATVTLWSFGRGYRGTTAAAHAAGVEVRFNPEWPASTVARELNGVLTEIYPTVYAVASHETAIPSAFGAIDLPEDAVGVISVWIEDQIHTDQWLREDRWDYNANSTTIGRGLRIGGGYAPGRGVRVVYAARPKLFNLNGLLTQDFATVTGLDARLSDVLAIGVAARLAKFIDVGRLPIRSAVATDMGQSRPAGAGQTTTRLFQSLFLARLEQEAFLLAKENPIRVHRVR